MNEHEKDTGDQRSKTRSSSPSMGPVHPVSFEGGSRIDSGNSF